MKKLITILICIAACNIMMFAQTISGPVRFGQSDKFLQNIPSAYEPGMELFNNINSPELKKSKSTYQLVGIKLYYATSKTDTIIFTYDGNGNKLTELRKTWQNNAWVNSSRYTYSYDINGIYQFQIYETWVTNAWVGIYRISVKYSGNIITLFLFEQWQNNAWVNASRQTYNVDGNNIVQNSIIEIWQNNAWVISGRESYTYDSKGNQLTGLRENWQNNAWVNYFRYTYIYDANGNRLTILDEEWLTDAWVNDFKYTYTYDSNGNMLTSLYELWQSNAWVNSDKYTYSYNTNGNRIVYLKEQWLSSAWVNDYKETYIYDSNGNGILTESYNWVTGNWVDNTTRNRSIVIIYNNAHGIFGVTGYKMEAAYQNFTGIAEHVIIDNTNLSNYPNPFSSLTTIRYRLSSASNIKLSIFDIAGKQVITLVNQAQQAGEYNIQFNAGSLQAGIYLLNYINENKTLNIKIVKFN